jgi:hypothetical protein
MPLEINTQGIGSYPEPPHGVHLTIRLTPNQPPLKRPYFFKASSVYWEHVG